MNVMILSMKALKDRAFQFRWYLKYIFNIKWKTNQCDCLMFRKAILLLLELKIIIILIDLLYLQFYDISSRISIEIKVLRDKHSQIVNH